jgi:hypothetical protein
MSSYNHKDKSALAYDEGKRRLRCEVQNVCAGVLNEALDDMTKQFNEGLHSGQLFRISFSHEEIAALFVKHLQPSPPPRAKRKA